jgi:hypothetical protein
MKLVEFAHAASGRRILVNPDHVIMVEDADTPSGGVLLTLAGEGRPQVYVAGDLDKVMRAFNPPAPVRGPVGYLG